MSEIKTIKGIPLCDEISRKTKVGLPTNADGTTNHGTIGQFAISDGNGGITWITVADGNEVEW